MCHHIAELYLHCSHITITQSYCSSNPQLVPALINTSAGSQTAVHPHYQTSFYQSVSLIERCPNNTHPETHSFLLCCPCCRGRFEHPKYEVVHGDQHERAHHTKRICSRSDIKDSTLPTCARLKMEEKSPAHAQPSTISQEHAASTFSYGLGFNINLQADQHDNTHTNRNPTAKIAKHEPEFEIVETYLRFPLTKCHHLIPFKMPETYLDGACDSILPCGCWTGKAPDAQMQEATLFVDYVGAETSFKSVWDVTGLGAGGCWECGALEFEVGDGNEYAGGVFEIGNSHGHTGSGQSATGDMRRINTEGGDCTGIEEAFLEDCEKWRKMEDWKDKWWNGDMTERGSKLMAESRWARTED